MHLLAAALLFFLLLPPAAAEPPATAALSLSPTAGPSDTMTMDTFLDRLMLAESGGRDDVANPRSTAVGPFQFVVATFLTVARRHFPTETAGLAPTQILALRTNRAFARRAAEAYTRDNAVHLKAAGLEPTWPHLRLAFFAGPEGAVRVLRAAAGAPVASVLGAAAVAANPFLQRLTTGGLVERAARDLQQPVGAGAGLAFDPAPTGAAASPSQRRIPVRCDLGLPSCRRWLALAERRQLRRLAAAAARAPARAPVR